MRPPAARRASARTNADELPSGRWLRIEAGYTVALGAVVRDARHERKMRQADLAEAAGMSKEFVSQIERAVHENPRIHGICALGSALEMPVHRLTDTFLLGRPLEDQIFGVAEMQTGVAARLPSFTERGHRALGQVLRTIRVDLGVPTKEAADLAHCGVSSVQQLEAGRIVSPGLLTLGTLLDALGHVTARPELAAFRLSLLAMVYQGELDAFEAIRRHRAASRVAAEGTEKAGGSGATVTAPPSPA